jgi:hypothetical protein
MSGFDSPIRRIGGGRKQDLKRESSGNCQAPRRPGDPAGTVSYPEKWAYAGYTFNLLGASASHAFSGDPFAKVLAPIIILAFVLVSYRQWKTGWM